MKLISYLIPILKHLLHLIFHKNVEINKVTWFPKHYKLKPISHQCPQFVHFLMLPGSIKCKHGPDMDKYFKAITIL